MKKYLINLLILLSISCGDDAFLKSATEPLNPNEIISGDIIVVSGDSVLRTAAPYPTHQINVFSATGVHKRTIFSAQDTSYLWGADFNESNTGLLFTIDNQDRIEQLSFSTFSSSIYFSNAAVGGSTVRAMARLSDNSLVIAEDRNTLEKVDSAGNRDTAGNFPFDVSYDINDIVRISGDRFAISFLSNTDNVRVYDNDGNLQGTFANPPGCTTNCDTSGILELSDGRFIISTMRDGYENLLLYGSDFSYVGVFFSDQTILRDVSTIALLRNGNIIACAQYQNTCEEISIDGNTGSRVGTTPLITNSNLIRVPSKVLVVP